MNFLPLAESLSLGDSLKFSGFGFVLVIAVLTVLAIFVKILTGIISGKKKTDTDDIKENIPAQQNEALSEALPQAEIALETALQKIDPVDEIPHIPGFVVLDGVAEQDAAVIMAITAEKTGIDLSRLDFKSIKRLNQNPVLENIEEQDAAAIMAITADKTGIPLENLIFNSIKLVED